jgi:hypothetical protein
VKTSKSTCQVTTGGINLSSKLRIRIGDVEIDYEGTEEFLKQELPELLKTAMELHRAAGPPGPSGDSVGNTAKDKQQPLSLTTGTIAAKLKVSSGGDLLLAAAAHLTLVSKKETFSRKELLAEMQRASSYYKKSYSGNLTNYLKSAVDGDELLETATDEYALTAKTRAELEAKLVNA